MELMTLVINNNETDETSLFTTSTLIGIETRVLIRAARGWALILSVFGSTGNILAIMTILWQIYLQRNRFAQHPKGSSEFLKPVIPFDGYTLLLLNLSICDLLYCSVNLPLTYHTYGLVLLNDTPTVNFCTGAALFRYLNALVEWMTLALITIQRCVDLRRSKGMRFFKPKPTIFFIIIIWTISSLPQLLILLQESGYTYISEDYKCDISDETARTIFFTMESSLPCMLMPIGCFGIIYQIWRNVKDLRESGMCEVLVKQRLGEMRKYVTLTLTLLILFLVCVVPICVYNVLHVQEDSKVQADVGILIYMVYWLLYVVNFILYIASKDNFRKAFRNLLLYIASKLKGDTDLPRIEVSSIQTMDKGDFDSVSQISVTSHQLRIEVSGTMLSSHSDFSFSTSSTRVSNTAAD